MELAEALRIVGALADGCDPLTGQTLPADNVCQQPQVVRALCLVVQQLRAPMLLGASAAAAPENAGKVLLGAPTAAPGNAGKPWTTAEEAELVRAFEAGVKLDQLARKHGRTRQAIHGRLYRLGKMPPW